MKYDKREFVTLETTEGQPLNLIRGTVSHVQKKEDGNFEVTLNPVTFQVKDQKALDGFKVMDSAGNISDPDSEVEPPKE